MQWRLSLSIAIAAVIAAHACSAERQSVAAHQVPRPATVRQGVGGAHGMCRATRATHAVAGITGTARRQPVVVVVASAAVVVVHGLCRVVHGRGSVTALLVQLVQLSQGRLLRRAATAAAARVTSGGSHVVVVAADAGIVVVEVVVVGVVVVGVAAVAHQARGWGGHRHCRAIRHRGGAVLLLLLLLLLMSFITL